MTCATNPQVIVCPALILRINGALDTVVVLRIEDGLVTGLHAVRNPEKLSRMHRETPLPTAERAWAWGGVR
ncbi:hypothetical protein ACFC08_02845 [Streptomyces sp. NPDC056112]|uniref:hypothetical protein n=1 Tax=unclassified Streptomyces TaxID=2593676 RepID=UPI001CD2B104|nr:hypothetical protein [Streptomyces sp. CoT10]